VLALSRQPESFRQQVEALPRGRRVVIDQGVLKAGHGVYTGSAELKDGPLHVWPLMRFLRALTAGNILD